MPAMSLVFFLFFFFFFIPRKSGTMSGIQSESRDDCQSKFSVGVGESKVRVK